MDTLIISVSLYLISANIVAGTIYVFGREKAKLLWIEYPFIYLPLIVFQVLSSYFSEIPALSEDTVSLQLFLFLLQGFSCGVIGAMILIPRFFFKAETTLEKLKVTAISALVFSSAYLLSRWILLQLFYFIVPEANNS